MSERSDMYRAEQAINAAKRTVRKQLRDNWPTGRLLADVADSAVADLTLIASCMVAGAVEDHDRIGYCIAADRVKAALRGSGCGHIAATL